jgi:hypothetical protein
VDVAGLAITGRWYATASAGGAIGQLFLFSSGAGAGLLVADDAMMVA